MWGHAYGESTSLSHSQIPIIAVVILKFRIYLVKYVNMAKFDKTTTSQTSQQLPNLVKYYTNVQMFIIVAVGLRKAWLYHAELAYQSSRQFYLVCPSICPTRAAQWNYPKHLFTQVCFFLVKIQTFQVCIEPDKHCLIIKKLKKSWRKNRREREDNRILCWNNRGSNHWLFRTSKTDGPLHWLQTLVFAQFMVQNTETISQGKNKSP